jgi:putative transposase
MAATVLEPTNIGGKVTPVRHEARPESLLAASGQEEVRDHY